MEKSPQNNWEEEWVVKGVDEIPQFKGALYGMKNKDERIREEFQKFADSIVWSNDDGSEKYIGVGNMADWWIDKMAITRLEEQERLRGLIGAMKKDENTFELPSDMEFGRQRVRDSRIGYNSALQNILVLLDKK